MVLRKYRPHIVAVTGNVGKTSAKDALYAALRRAYYVRKSEKSYNSSDIGVALSILGVPNAWMNPIGWAQNILEGLRLIFLKNHYPKWLILEVGADRPGEIASVASWLRPDIVVITKIGDVPVHVEFFASPQEVVAEKGTLVEALAPEGLLVLDFDSPRAMSLAAKTTARTVTYGFGEEAHFVASHAEIMYSKEGVPEGITFKINHGTRSVPIRIKGTVGQHHAYPVLAAITVSVSEGTNLVSAAQWIEEEYTPPPGRLCIIKGINDSVILDDTYNASPSAVQSALAALESVKGKRKIAVLGDMMELGKHSVEEHQKIGETVSEAADIFFAVGPRMKAAGEKAREKGLNTVEFFSDARAAGDALRKILKTGDVVLMKGSQSLRMERVVEQVMLEPERRKELLVRQDNEWLSR